MTNDLDSDQFGHRDLVDAITLLEEALPKIPDPTGIYLALYDMYMDMEDMSQAGGCLVEAAKRVAAGAQPGLTYFLYSQLELFADLSPHAKGVHDKLATMIDRDDQELGANTLHLDQRRIYKYDLVPELLLARHLHRANQVSPAEFHMILQDLCHYSPSEPTTPNTALCSLHSMDLPHKNAVLEFLVHDSGVPYINLDLFEVATPHLRLLPAEFVRIRGACVFGMVGPHPMVGLLNPYNLQLRDDVNMLIGKESHIFLLSAEGFLHTLEHLHGGKR